MSNARFQHVLMWMQSSADERERGSLLQAVHGREDGIRFAAPR